ncbi:MAG TPA: class I SAM-dependent methyltransferase [Phycisphaerales bacterium]|jgi:SAM-dependent methyltransferase|nr:class I SAM-dependent methyltransferase [Phycisphaerales bacterium]
MTAMTSAPAAPAALPEPVPPREFFEDDAPLIPTQDVPACPVCGGTTFVQHAIAFDYELRTCRNAWRFVRCTDCSHIWLNPRPAISTLSVIYPPHYYAYHYTEKVSPLALRIKNALDRRKFGTIRSVLGGAPRPLRGFADIGCGDGRYLAFARAAGVPDAHNYGLELDPSSVERLRARGFAAVCARVEDCREIAPASLDLATMFHVIEHVDDPRAVVEGVAAWIAPGGVFAVETPNIAAWDARLFARTYWGGYHVPRHWNMFTPVTLARLLRDAGLEVVATRFQTGHSFWMYSMHHLTRYAGASRPRLSRMFDPFGGWPALPALAAFTAFDKFRAALGVQTSSMLMIARKPG